MPIKDYVAEKTGIPKVASDIQPHQQQVIDKMRRHDGVLVYHGLGSGKTLTALAVAKDQKKPLSVVGPASLRGNFEKENKKHKTGVKIQYSTYNKPNPNPNNVLAFDEAHRMGRYGTKVSKMPDQYAAHKKMFLTGTPIRNEPSELIPLLRGIGVDAPKDPKRFNEVFLKKVKHAPSFIQRIKGVKDSIEYVPKNLSLLTRLAEDKVDYHPSQIKGFPTTNIEDINVPMTEHQVAAYKTIMRQDPGIAYKIKYGLPAGAKDASKINYFLSQSRQVLNNPLKYSGSSEVNPKVALISSQLGKTKSVVYSQFLDSGVNLLAQDLKSKKIPYATFTGKDSLEARKKAISDYNTGKIKTLLISGAGGEGLDLKGTRALHIMEPHWNNEKLNQVRGRVARYGSHDGLKPSEKNVSIKTYYSTMPKSDELTSDLYLKRMSDKKKALNDAFLVALQKADLD